MVMIAGPYRSHASSEAEIAANLRTLNEAALAVYERGHLPVIGVNLALPIIEVAGVESYDRIMLPLSLALADRCDAILRVGGRSEGADEEVARIERRGGRVFASVGDIPAQEG